MHLTHAVQLARQLSTGLENRRVLRGGQLGPALQQRVEIIPAVEGTGQQDRLNIALDLALAENAACSAGIPSLL